MSATARPLRAGRGGAGAGALDERLRWRANRLLTRANGSLPRAYPRLAQGEQYGSVLGVGWSLLARARCCWSSTWSSRKHFGAQIEAYPLYLLLGIVSSGFFATATRYLITVFLFPAAFAAEHHGADQDGDRVQFGAAQSTSYSSSCCCAAGLSAVYYGLFSWGSVVSRPPRSCFAYIMNWSSVWG